MGYGKLIAVVGAILTVLKPIFNVMGVNTPDMLYWIGVTIIIIGALIYLLEKK